MKFFKFLKAFMFRGFESANLIFAKSYIHLSSRACFADILVLGSKVSILEIRSLAS